MDTARTDFGITLTYSTNKCTVLTSQVKVIVLIMSEALFTLGARLCKISFFEMKWSISSTKSTISSSGIVCKWVLQFQPDRTYLTMARDISHTRYWYSSSAINIIRRICTWRARCTKCEMHRVLDTLSVSHFLSIVCRSQGLPRVDQRDLFIYPSAKTWWRATNYIYRATWNSYWLNRGSAERTHCANVVHRRWTSILQLTRLVQDGCCKINIGKYVRDARDNFWHALHVACLM